MLIHILCYNAKVLLLVHFSSTFILTRFCRLYHSVTKFTLRVRKMRTQVTLSLALKVLFKWKNCLSENVYQLSWLLQVDFHDSIGRGRRGWGSSF